MIVRSSRVVQPPVSGVPVAGATVEDVSDRGENVGRGEEEDRGRDVQAGSRVSMSMDRYTGFSVPTRSRIFLIMPCIPITSISLASTISNPQYPSLS